ncbi:hypothetical protein F8M41_022240 [Gigaspora margarita]|uniref:F-box domain-containing protein n=1 Tax=Gigaspora margarita TaxID=4874 RepID=A0A8H4AFF8_GIGMA|nr:hypothetical protein F8M41_022240 [Gigaspora margarita]
MISLPTECLFKIFNNLRNDYKSLFFSLLVNRQWCRIIVPILWSEPTVHFGNRKLIKIFLLTLNTEEQTSLIPFKIAFQNYQKPLFEYTSYITSVSDCLYNGIKNWLRHERHEIDCRLENAIKCSLISMFLRTSKNLKCLSLNGFNYNNIVFETLYKNTTIISIHYYTNDGFKFKAIEVLV